MPVISDTNKHQQKITDIADRYAIKNYVLKDGTKEVPAQSMQANHIFNGFMLAICIKGEATLKVNYKEYPFREGDIFNYMPGQILRVKDHSDDFLLEALFLSADFVVTLPLSKDFDLLKRVAAAPVKKVSYGSLQNLLEFNALIAKHHARVDNPYRDRQVKSIIFALVMEISALYSIDATDNESHLAVSRQELLTDDFFSLMRKNYKTERNVAYYADKLCLTPKYLSMTVKKITGHSIREWLNEMVIIESKRLLKTTDMTSLQISEELNFPNPSFFGRFFKQYAGMTPIQYKNS